ncbi:kinase-like domain-containing protein [Haematococcus lacustris]
MVALRGPFVAELTSWFQDEDSVWLAMELCEGGDLFKSLMLHGGRLDEHYVCTEIIAPLLRVLEKSHAMNIMHRDIKPENLFLTRYQKIRVGDFGLAVDWSKELPFSRSGTLLQESSDVTLEQLQAKGIKPYDDKVDVWAVGVLAYEMVVGKPPFEVEDEAQTANLIMTSNAITFPTAHSSMWADFVRSVLVKDPQQRPSAAQLMHHPW